MNKGYYLEKCFTQIYRCTDSYGEAMLVHLGGTQMQWLLLIKVTETYVIEFRYLKLKVIITIELQHIEITTTCRARIVHSGIKP